MCAQVIKLLFCENKYEQNKSTVEEKDNKRQINFLSDFHSSHLVFGPKNQLDLDLSDEINFEKPIDLLGSHYYAELSNIKFKSKSSNTDEVLH